ncbi:MAG TPA: ATPase, T2SS/T4P/T4SS family, partial [Polyangiaceae bacterium]|nr:ATPase, T2SS/T4P/T4SS family [Polyangiaceae bacterium]
GGGKSVRRVRADRPISVGRQSDCSVCVPDDHISRRHAVLHFSEKAIRVEDVSSNGTLAGKTLLCHESADVPYGTPILIGVHTIYARPATEPHAAQRHAFGKWRHTPSRPHAIVRGPESPGPEPRPERAAESPRAPEAPPSLAQVQPAPVALATPSERRADAALRREIHQRLLQHIDLATIDAAKLDDASFRPRVLTALRRIVRGMEESLPPDTDMNRLIGEMADEALGLGPLEHLLLDPEVTEVMVIDADTIYVERRGKIELTAAHFTDDDRVRAVIERIVTPLGRRIDESSPLVDARLADGSRVNAIIRPLALRGSCITIRKFARTPLTLDALGGLGALTKAMGRFLTRSVIAKKNILISGGTGSGKTTLLNVLSAAIPPGERIVTIEDSAELKLAQPHVVSLETRPPNMEGKGEYTIRDLVKNALRMRPDRIVIGECRGGEALDMLQAMNTGHDGSLTTTHANSPAEALARLETLVLMAGVDLPSRAIREQIGSSIQLIVQQARLSDGSRKVTEVSEVTGLDRSGEFQTRALYRFVRTGTGPQGQVLGDFGATGNLPTYLDELIVRGLVKRGEPYL